MESVDEQRKSSFVWRARILGLVALPFLCIGAYWIGSLNRASPPSKPQRLSPIHIELASLDFGEVLENKRFTYTLRMENATQQPIHIAQFNTSCNCASIEPPSIDLPAGAIAR